MKLELSFSFYLILCLGFSVSLGIAATADAASSHIVPTFTVKELRDGSRDTDLLKILTSTGLLALRVPMEKDRVNDEPFSLVAGEGLLCRCKDDIGNQKIPRASGGQEGVSSAAEKILLADGLTTRSTIATATNGLYDRLPLPKDDIVQICGEEVYSLLERARDYVSRASNDYFIPALDRLIEASSHGQHHEDTSHTILTKANGQGYTSIASIVQDAINLEHFHSYSKRNVVENNKASTTLRSSSTAAAIDDALDWHTDGGLFLAFLPAKSCSHPEQPDDSFVIKLPNTHSETKVIFPQDQVGEVVVGIMLGIGAEEWLATSSSSFSSSSTVPLQFRATRHAVKMIGGDERVWYGKMHLVSQDAIVYKKDKKSFEKQHLTFSEFRKSSQGRSMNASSSDNNRHVAIGGCGSNHHDPLRMSSQDSLHPEMTIYSHSIPLRRERRRVQHVGGPDECNNINSFYCWLSCLDIPDDSSNHNQHSFQYHTDQMGESLYCLDPSILARTNNLQQAVEACSNPTTGEAGGIMNEACGNYWHATVDGVPTYTSLYAGGGDGENATVPLQYCYGKTGMYMQGFEWEATTCVIFLFSSWVITTRTALFGACIGTILLGMLVEAIIYQRRTILGKSYPKGKGGGGKKKMVLSALLYGA